MRDTAQRVFAVTAEMQGYPSDLTIGPHGRDLTVSGLAPSQATKAKVMTRLAQVLPGTDIRDKLTVVAGSNAAAPDVKPQLDKLSSKISTVETGIEALVARRSSDRAEQRLAQAAVDLTRAATGDAKWGEALTKSAANLQTVIAGIKSERQSLGEASGAGRAQQAAAYLALAAKIAEQSDTVTSLITGTPAAKPVVITDQPAAPGLQDATGSLAAEAERMASISSTIALAKALRPAAAPIQVAAPQVTPRERLRNVIASKAIFFGNGTDYRDSQTSAQVLQELAPLVKAAGVLVRVVGYTDEAGGARRNQPLAQSRAEKVRQDLMTFGAPASLLSPIGRVDVLDLSPSQGTASPNRRVEFELGFDGEALP